MNRILAIILSGCFFMFIEKSGAQEKQNVLMIVLDDLNDFVGVMGGHPQARTPNIDKLANQGVLFLNAHSNVPVCMPSRASFMNGILPTSSGNWGFQNWLKNETLINSKSLPEYFRDNGYAAFQSGKVFHNAKKGVWNEMGAIADYGPMAFNGSKAVMHPSCPPAMGVLGPLDATFASLADVPEVKPTMESSGYKGWRNTNRKTNSHFHYIDDENRDKMTDEKSVQWFETKMKALEKAEDPVPFFISVGLIRPHTPLVVPQKYFDMFPIDDVQIPILKENDKSDTKLGENSKKEPRGRTAYRTLTESFSSREEGLRKYTQAYLASVAFADDMVGKLLKALDESKFNENTIVLLFSDHGYNLGQKDYLFKYALWEESTRVPLIFRVPGNNSNAGKKVQSPVSLVDLYPTLQDLCDLKGTTMLNDKGAGLNGFSLKPLIENPEAEQWNGPDVALSVIASWKSKKPEEQHLSVRSRDFRYIHYFNGAEELYDHRVDQYEWNNIADDPDYDEIKQTLKKKLFLEIDKK